MKTVIAAVVAMLILVGSAAGDPIPGQVDDFQDGTTRNWTIGRPFIPSAPVNVANGGLLGAGDAFLSVTSTGGGGAGSKPVTYNFAQWTGDYLTAGVNAIRMDLNNTGGAALVLRLLLDGGGGRFHTAGVTLAPGGGWQSATFSVDPVSLIASGGFNANATMAGVSRLWIFHNPNLGFPGPGLVAAYGVDNITALPEPVTPGDTNDDDIVDHLDLSNLVAQFGGPPGIESADFNDDDRVDLVDFTIMRDNFGFGVVSSPGVISEAIMMPEPGTLGLLSVAGLLAMFRRRRRPTHLQHEHGPRV
ncbi:MAG: PEP-CTERM sorting domain-containing protein [Phycisphaerae bacterium]|nr:PEP-CTERM sorting domain-containing protein [Phycisphaerae bacterium]